MILGAYWYFGFPTDLYKFDYFKFSKGCGGHADNAAELFTNIEVDNPEKLIGQLKSLIEKYKDGYLFILQDGNKLKIGTSSHQLYDYDFLLIAEVEKLFRNENITVSKDLTLENPNFIRLYNENETRNIIYPTKSFLQVIGSSLRKHNAETSALRLDCNLMIINKQSFISEIAEITKSESINVFYYFNKEFHDKVNLMMVFSNGRQGLDFAKRQFINTSSFENKLEILLQKFNVKVGHEGGIELYPKNGPTIELMIDKEFILG